jgi:hypothetical protein
MTKKYYCWFVVGVTGLSLAAECIAYGDNPHVEQKDLDRAARELNVTASSSASNVTSWHLYFK